VWVIRINALRGTSCVIIDDVHVEKGGMKRRNPEGAPSCIPANNADESEYDHREANEAQPYHDAGTEVRAICVSGHCVAADS
jgi:hypothetical protein